MKRTRTPDPLDAGFGTPTQAAFGMHDRLADEAPSGGSNVPNHPATSFANLSVRDRKHKTLSDLDNVDDGHGGGPGAGPGNENSFGGSNYSGNYGGGY